MHARSTESSIFIRTDVILFGIPHARPWGLRVETQTQLNIKALARSIQSGKCILVLGSGASTHVDREGRETRLHVMLANQFWESLQEKRDDIDPNDLRHVSQILYDETGEQTPLQFEVSEFYGKFATETTDLHRDLAALPFQMCISTSSDDLLFNAFKEVGKKPVREYYDFRTPRQVTITPPTVEHPLVYHFYGYSEPPESQVITETDLVDFLTRVVRNDPPLPDYIRATLSKRESACLFIDLDFKHWYLRVLVHVLGYQDQHVNRSWAVEHPEFFVEPKQHQSIAYFSSRKTINFHNESLKEFVKRLRDAYAEVAGKETAPGVVQPNSDAPLAFLSYANEDRELIDALNMALRNAGVRVWQDKDDLRGGDNWETQLTHVIGKLADYVVVVQTPTMVNRIRGVFNTEIDEALKTQRTMPAFRFVIPVHTAENCLMLQFEREKLHSLQVRIPGDASALAKTILEDWAARNTRRTRGAGA